MAKRETYLVLWAALFLLILNPLSAFRPAGGRLASTFKPTASHVVPWATSDGAISDEDTGSNADTSADSSVADTTVVPAVQRRKMSWPFDKFDAAEALDGTLAGDAGFDPLGVAQDKENLFLLREAEVKHSRIAMLAVVGWPLSELYHYKLSAIIGFDDILADGGRAPSVLNGGLDNVYALFALGEAVSVWCVGMCGYLSVLVWVCVSLCMPLPSYIVLAQQTSLDTA